MSKTKSLLIVFRDNKRTWRQHTNVVGVASRTLGSCILSRNRVQEVDGSAVFLTCALSTTLDNTDDGTSFIRPRGGITHRLKFNINHTWQTTICSWLTLIKSKILVVAENLVSPQKFSVACVQDM